MQKIVIATWLSSWMIGPRIAYLQVGYQMRFRLIYKSPYLLKIDCFTRSLNFSARLLSIRRSRLYSRYCFQQLSLESISGNQKLQ